MAVKNVVFEFSADTTKLSAAIDALNKQIQGLKSGAKVDLGGEVRASSRRLSEEEKATRAAKREEERKLQREINEDIKKANAQQSAFIKAQAAEKRAAIAAERAEVQKAIKEKAAAESAAIKAKREEERRAQREKTEQERAARRAAINEERAALRAKSAEERAAIRARNAEERAAAREAAAAQRATARPFTPIAAAPSGPGFGDVVRGGLATFGIIATVDALVDLSRSTVQAAIDFERLTASFRALIGDKERADQAIKDIQQFALETPFDVTNVALASKTLLGYGISVNDLIPTLQRLGDVSAASGGDIQRVALAYGQIAAKGKLQGEEIRQLVNVGFNPLQEIAKRTGETMSDLAKRVEAGQVSFDEVAQAFQDATSEGGRFFELSKTLTDTFGGQLQKLGEQINLFKIQLGGIVGDELRPLVEGLQIFFKELAESAQNVRDNALVLGLWKAALGLIIGLLAKSANLFILNNLNAKGLTKTLGVLRLSWALNNLSLQANNRLIVLNAGATRLASVSANIYNGALKGLTFATNILSTATKSLFAVLAANPIGIAIAAYTIFNSILERNSQLRERELLDSKGLIDINAELKRSQADLAGSTKARQSSIESEFKAVAALIQQRGTENENVKLGIKNLQDTYKLNLDNVTATTNRIEAVKRLNAALKELNQQEALNIRKSFLESEIKKFEDDLALAEAETRRAQKAIFKETNDEFFLARRFLGGTTEGYREATDGAAAFGKQASRDREILKRLRKELDDVNASLIDYGDGADGAGEKSDKLAKALKDLLDYLSKLKDTLDDLGRKTLEFDISILPTVTEQNQIQKIEALFNFAKSEADRLKQIELDGLNERLEAYRKAGATELQLETLKTQGKTTIEENYFQRVLLEERKFENELKKTRQDFRDEDLKNLRKYTDDALEQLKRLKEEQSELLGERITTTIQDFERSPIGAGKRYKERLKEERQAALDNINEISQAEQKRIDIDNQRAIDEINKKYKYEKTQVQLLFESGVPLTREQEAQRQRDNETEVKQAQEKKNALATIEQDYNIKTENNRRGSLKRQQKLEDDTNKALEEARISRIGRIFDEVKASVDAAFTIANAAIEAEMMKNDALISLQEKRVEEARKIADQGNAALFEAEKKRLDDLNKERAKAVRQQQALIFAQVSAESALAVAKAAAQGGGFLSPILIASVIASLAAGFISARAAAQAAVGGFAEGGWTGKGGKYEPAGVVHREEFVVKKGPAEKFRPMLEQLNRGRDPFLAAGLGKQVIMINNVGVEDRLARIEKAITGQDRMTLSIDESGIHGIVSHYQFKNQRIRNRAK